MSKEIVLVGACRTAIGKMGGTLSNIPAEQLGAIVMKEAIARAGISADQIDEVIFGNVLTAAMGQSPARSGCDPCRHPRVRSRDDHQQRLRKRPEVG